MKRYGANLMTTLVGETCSRLLVKPVVFVSTAVEVTVPAALILVFSTVAAFGPSVRPDDVTVYVSLVLFVSLMLNVDPTGIPII